MSDSSVAERQAITLAVINHNGAEHLRRILPAVVDLKRQFAEILLLDNASSDASPALFRQFLPDGRVVAMPDNRSPGTARDAAMREAANDVILFIDNDVLLTPDCADALARAMADDPDAVLAMPRVVYADRPDVVQYDGADCHFLGHMILRNEDTRLADCRIYARRMNSIVTACFLLDRRRWAGGPLFDDAFSFYYEDHDLALRTRLRGQAIVAVPEVVVLHGEGTADLSFRPGGRYAARRVLTLVAGRWLCLAKVYSLRTLILLGPILIVYEVFQFAGMIKKGWVRHWFGAIAWVWRHRAALGRERARAQASRRVPDRALLQGGAIPYKSELGASRAERLAIRFLNRLANAHWRLVRQWI